MRQFLDVFGFELAFRRRHAPLYIFTGFCFLFGFLTMAIRGGMEIFGGVGAISINAPVALQFMMLNACLLFGLVITTAFVAASVIRDEEYGVDGLLFATPLRKAPYLLGRFGGAMAAACIMISGVAVGAFLGSLMPWHDPERLVPITLAPYLYSLGVFVFPNLVFVGALAFSVATLSGRMMYSYVTILGLIVIYVVSGNFIADLDNDLIAALSDPFGIRAYALATRYFTPVESNTIAAPYVPEIAINRAIWLGLGLLVLAGTVARYRMALRGGQATRARATAPRPEATPHRGEPPPLPKVTPRFDMRTKLAQLAFQTRVEVRGLVRSAPFIVIALFGVGNVVGGAFGILRQGGTTTLPVTHLMLTIVQGAMSLFMLIVLVFYAGELVHRERRYKLAEFYDALPVPNWVPLLSKLAAMVVGMVVLMLVAAATTMSFQLAKGYPRLELGLYLHDLSTIQVHVWIVMSVAAVFLQIVANHKFVGYLLMVLVFVLQAALPAMDFEHNVYSFAAMPSVNYSDMNGYGHFAMPRFVFTLYWLAFAAILGLVAELLWVRGTDNPWRLRWREAKLRLDARRLSTLAIVAAIWLGLGGVIVYNTTVINVYRPSDEVEALQVRYEREYKQYEGMAQPRVTAVDIDAELYPHERRVIVRGTMHLVNKTDQPISEFHVVGQDESIEATIEIPGAALTHDDAPLSYRIYTLAEPMVPGAQMDISFDYRKHLRGFANESADNSIVANGTFFNSFAYTPHFGYSPAGELTDPNDRRKHDLPPRPRMAKIDDHAARQNTYLATDSDWIEFSAEMSTAADQIAVAPGYLVKEWAENGRRHFRYEMDSKILNFWSILSADYQVERDEWEPKDGGKPVAIEIFYHHAHPYNVAKMITSIKDSLDYFTANFSPYQHRQVRVLEFPKYASFAQSFPNTIPYSESIGFIADASADEDIDYVYYVTSHEVAHQWWAHQVIGANVQGCTMMSESLAQYSSLMVMEKHYGPDKMPKFLEYELDRYLRARSGETIEELPLLLVENQQYIHYSKGSLVFYALKEYIGEAALNGALRDYIAEVAFQDAPFTVSTDLYAHLEKATPAKYQYLLEDMFKKIALYDNRTTRVSVRPRDDGKFDVTITGRVQKLYADGKGVETPAESMADWIEIGVYVEREDENGKPTDVPLLLEQHQLEAGDVEITVVVDEEPSHAGIDPRHLLIDREPDDNRKKAEMVDAAGG